MNEPVVSGLQQKGLVAYLDDDLPFQYIEGLFKRMEMLLNHASCIKVANPRPHVNRSYSGANVGRATKPVIVHLVTWWNLC
jgi:hypothetical protein